MGAFVVASILIWGLIITGCIVLAAVSIWSVVGVLTLMLILQITLALNLLEGIGY